MTQAIGWTLIHSLWQGAAIAILLAWTLWTLRRASAQARYVASCAALVLMPAASLVTFLRMPVAGSGPAVAIVGVTRGAPAALLAGSASPGGIDLYMPWVTWIWLAGVLALSLRWTLAWGWLRYRSRTEGWQAPAEVRTVVDRLRDRLRISKTIRLRAADWLASPAVTGVLRPVLLLPASALTGLTPDQLEAVLAHELAHVRRHDYLVNLLQTAVETLFFYHPAAWWISHRIRVEREHCCDDVAVALCGDRVVYAGALLELARPKVPHFAMAAAGGGLQRRISRLLYGPQPASAVWPVTAAVLALAALGLWSGRSMLAQSSQLPGQYVKWVNQDVAYIISDAERSAFLKLTTAEEAEHFIEQFWARRDPSPGTPQNEFKDEYYRRIAYSNNRFTKDPQHPGWMTDRGEIYIYYGPPDEIEVHPVDHREEWMYHWIEGAGANVVFQFLDDRLVARDERYRRIAYANAKFGDPGARGSLTGRGRIYVAYGPPDEIERNASHEKWLYRNIPGVGQPAIFEFQGGELVSR